jgi:20S proteasome alpha/beta subunit
VRPATGGGSGALTREAGTGFRAKGPTHSRAQHTHTRARPTSPLTPSPPPAPSFVDPRAGSYVANRVSDKLTAVHDRIYCCRSGSAADTQAVSDYVRRFLGEHALDKGKAPTVQVASKLFRGICYQNKDRLLAGIIVAGWDAVDGGSVYEIPLGGTCVRQNFAIGGSGSTYIYGFVDSQYRPGACGTRGARERWGAWDGERPDRAPLHPTTWPPPLSSLTPPCPLPPPARPPILFRAGMSKEECLSFVQRALSHAMARDGSSGGVIRTVIIEKDGVTRGFIPGDKLHFDLYRVGGGAASGAGASTATAEVVMRT